MAEEAGRGAGPGMGWLRRAVVAGSVALVGIGMGSAMLPSEAEAAKLFSDSQDCSTTKKLVGGVLGAPSGGLLGNRIGDGSGQKIATVLSGIGGAAAGAAIACRTDTRSQAQRQVEARQAQQARVQTAVAEECERARAEEHARTGTEAAARLPPHKRQPNPRVVAAVQSGLMALGYDPGVIDGLSGPRTRAAVREFQHDLGLAPTGQVSQELAVVVVAFLKQAELPREGGMSRSLLNLEAAISCGIEF